MTLQEMQDHLDALAMDHLYCRLDQAPNMAGMMYVEFGYVEGPEMEEGSNGHYPNAESRYLVCLHELGHFNHGHTQGRPWNDAYKEKTFDYYSPDWWVNEGIGDKWYFENGVLNSEAQAWNYALDKCLIPSAEILPETRAFMWDTCLGSYFNHARAVGFETPGQLLYNGDRHYIDFAYGKPNKYFLQTKRRILEGDIEEDLPEENHTVTRPGQRITLQDWTNTINSNTINWTSGTNTIYSTTNT